MSINSYIMTYILTYFKLGNGTVARTSFSTISARYSNVWKAVKVIIAARVVYIVNTEEYVVRANQL